MAARTVIQRVLDELESGDADAVKRFVIGAAGIAQRDGGNAKVFEWLHPLGEDRSHGSILLQVDTANLAAAIIKIEVAGNLLILRLELDRTARLANPLG